MPKKPVVPEVEVHAEVRDLKTMYDLRQSVQKQRIRFSNQISAIERGDSTAQRELLDHFAARYEGMEKDVDGLIAEAVVKHSAWPWLESVRGIGPALAGRLLAPIDITKANTVSALWKYAGQGVTDGVRDKPTKGEKLPYNADLKSTCWLISTSFLRSGSPYRKFYDEKKALYQLRELKKGKDAWTPGHIDYAAKRYMVKMFLSHLWTVWREAEGLSVSKPYAIAILNHADYVGPAEVKEKPSDKERAIRSE